MKRAVMARSFIVDGKERGRVCLEKRSGNVTDGWKSAVGEADGEK